MEGVFDVKAVRAALEARLRSVEAEKQQVRSSRGTLAIDVERCRSCCRWKCSPTAVLG